MGGEAGESLSTVDRQAGEDERRQHESSSHNKCMDLLHFAHDLRNLMLPVLLSTELLLESPGLTPLQQGRLKLIVQRLDFAQRFIEDILWAQQGLRVQQVVNIPSLVQRVLEQIRQDFQTEVRCLMLVERTVGVAGNEDRLWRALYNLVLNGAEAAGQFGSVLVRVLNDEMPAMVRLEVQNSGDRMTPDPPESIFSPFFTTKQSHTGLGLSFVKEVVEQHHGTISINSEPGRLTILAVRLPMVKT